MGAVNYFDKSSLRAEDASKYTAPSDFCRVFKDETRGLYALSLLLTADPELAKKCFVAGLDDCLKGNPVFKDWASAWSRRAIIMNAIRTVLSQRIVSLSRQNASDRAEWNLITDGPLAVVIHLDSLERFVFVMSFLEGYSDHECSVLLNRSRGEIAATRTLALQQLAELGWLVEAQR